MGILVIWKGRAVSLSGVGNKWIVHEIKTTIRQSALKISKGKKQFYRIDGTVRVTLVLHLPLQLNK